MNRLAKIVEGFLENASWSSGDAIADQFNLWEISRVSREAPSSFCVTTTPKTTPGGAGKLRGHLAALGAKVELISVLVVMSRGKSYQQASRGGRGCDGVRYPPIGDHHQGARLRSSINSAQVIRIDYDNEPTSVRTQGSIERDITRLLTGVRPRIISDYNYGVRIRDAELVRDAVDPPFHLVILA